MVVAAMDLAKSKCANRVRGRYSSQHRKASSNATELCSTLCVENKIRDLKVSLRRPQTATRILKTRPSRPQVLSHSPPRLRGRTS
jgi:hypothetical protein